MSDRKLILVTAILFGAAMPVWLAVVVILLR